MPLDDTGRQLADGHSWLGSSPGWDTPGFFFRGSFATLSYTLTEFASTQANKPMATASPGAGLRNFSVLYSSEPGSISDEHIQPDGDRHAPSATSALVRSPSH
jgi:hypothetical protein